MKKVPETSVPHERALASARRATGTTSAAGLPVRRIVVREQGEQQLLPEGLVAPGRSRTGSSS